MFLVQRHQRFMKAFVCTANVVSNLRLVQSAERKSTAGEIDGYGKYIYIYIYTPPIDEVLGITYLAKKSISVVIADNFGIVSEANWVLVQVLIW